MNYTTFMSTSTPGAGPPDMGLEPVDLATTALASLAVADAVNDDGPGMINAGQMIPEL